MPDLPSAAAGVSVRLLVAGDLHLGRAPARIPPGEPTLSTEAAFTALADTAIARGVDALVLTGDVADAGNKYFEAAGVIERVLRRLIDAEVPVFAVAGSDDHDVLGAVEDRIGSPLVRVLGRGQTWETARLERDGRDVLRLAGWSFAGPQVTDNPLSTFPADLDGDGADLPTVGVLYTHVVGGAEPSRFAPTTRASLSRTPVAAWLLGHDHTQGVSDGDGPLLVSPGSLQPLGPDETGVHGAVLVSITPGGAATAEPVSLATLQYGRVDVDLSEAQTGDDARALVADALRTHAASVRETSPSVLRAVVTVRLQGRTSAFGDIEALARELRQDGATAHAGLTVAVARIESAAGPDLDLGRLAAGSGAVATLARLSARLGLDGPLDESALKPTDRALVARAADAVRAARGARVFETLAADGRFPDDARAEAVARLRRQVSRLLDTALAQNDD